MQLKKKKKAGKFSSVEDLELGRAVAHNIGALKGEAWKNIALSLPGRSARQCRDPWSNYVDPDLKAAPWSKQEFQLLHLAQESLGKNQWAKMRHILPQRSSLGITTASKSTVMQEWRQTFVETPADTKTLQLFHERMEAASLPGKNRSMPSKYKQAPRSTSRGGACAKDSGGASSGDRQGVPSTRDLHSSQKRVALVVWSSEDLLRI
ncbi:unnamed protein product, partial [Ectocarpus fasciculatus]